LAALSNRAGVSPTGTNGDGISEMRNVAWRSVVRGVAVTQPVTITPTPTERSTTATNRAGVIVAGTDRYSIAEIIDVVGREVIGRAPITGLIII